MLETKYLLACTWEGQEGSFLLWSFWHCILGLVVIRNSKAMGNPCDDSCKFNPTSSCFISSGTLYFLEIKSGLIHLSYFVMNQQVRFFHDLIIYPSLKMGMT